MNTRIPGIAASLPRSRRTTSVTDWPLRSAGGFSPKVMFPELISGGPAPSPTRELTTRTAGSAAMICAARVCNATISANEMPSRAWVRETTMPVSSDGKKPLGMTW
jgi:hypothetical protein